MRPAFVEGIDRSFNDIRRRIEIGFPDFQMNDVLALAFQRARFVQNFESGFGTEPRHAAGEAKLILGGIFHDGKPGHYTPKAARSADPGIMTREEDQSPEYRSPGCVTEERSVRDGVLFALGAQHSIDGVGRTPGGLVVVTNLHLSQQANRQHVEPGQE